MVKHLASILLACAFSAHAGLAPKQTPDNFSRAPEHFFLVGFVPGIVVGTAWPEVRPGYQFAICSIPGLVHELAPSKGNYRSNRDILVNSIGCGMGLWAATGFSVGASSSSVRVSYSVRF
jgi:hypothetical protein